MLESCSAVVGEYLKVDAVPILLTEFIQCGELRDLNQVVVATVGGLVLADPDAMYAINLLFKKVATSGRNVPLVLVVRARKPLWLP